MLIFISGNEPFSFSLVTNSTHLYKKQYFENTFLKKVNANVD